MKIQYASDLHLEFGMNSRYMQVYGLAEGGDILLLAGDVGYLEKRRVERDPFFDWCSCDFHETVIVPGNHEYYRDPVAREGHQDGIAVEKTLMEYEHKVRHNVRYLNNRSIIIGDVEVFATTLWSVVPQSDWFTVESGMNDCRQILYEGHHLRASDYIVLHGICKAWLAEALEKSKAKKKVVLTHHCPSTDQAFSRYEPTGGLSSAFLVDMHDFIAEHDIDIWLYGHTHFNGGSGTVVPSRNPNGTKLLCNQLGYIQLAEDRFGFNPSSCFVGP